VLHHLGRWTDAFGDEADRLTNFGALVQVDGRTYGRGFAYVRAPKSGLTIELVSRAGAGSGLWANIASIVG
jgi:hypothetical protein